MHIRSANQPVRMDLLAINLVVIFSIRILKSFFQMFFMFFITKRRCDLADTVYDLIDPTPPPPTESVRRDDQGLLEPDVDYDDTYGGNSPSNVLHTDSINPASKVAKKKIQRRRLSSIYGRRRGSIEYTTENVRATDDQVPPSFWSSFRGSFRASATAPSPEPAPQPSAYENSNFSFPTSQMDPTTAIIRSRANTWNSRKNDHESLVEDGVEPIPKTTVSQSPAPLLGAGTYTAIRTNYDVSYREMNRVERDYELKSWQANIESVKLYADLLIGFGFIAIFGCLLPGISLLGALDLYLTYKKDAFRFINVYRRIRSSLDLTADIGSYYLAFNTFIAIAIVTNALLIVFTMISFRFLTIAIRLWIFIAINGVLYLFRHMVSLLFTLEPKIVKIQRLRSNFIGKKLIEQVPDEEADPTSIL
jgi:hypothetical protein